MHVSIERQNLLSILHAALRSVNGRQVIGQFLGQTNLTHQTVAVVAIGKAAYSMFEGAVDVQQNQIVSGLLITRDGYLGNTNKLPNTECLLAGHPLPDERSLFAGNRLIDWLRALPAGLPLVVLISGGTSALVEKLPPSITLSDLQHLNQWLLSSGLSIEIMNQLRRSISMIKGGRLLAHVGDRPLLQLLISDVPEDDPATIGSGLFCREPDNIMTAVDLPEWLQQMQHQAIQSLENPAPYNENIQTIIVASNSIACEAARQQATTFGYQSQIVTTTLQGDVNTCADQIMNFLNPAPPGCYIWGGETTVYLPTDPGRGGRNQQLALLLARKLRQMANCDILCIGTDGTDGNSEDAGALVDTGTIARGTNAGFDVDSALRQANTGSFLDASGDLINTGPTGTNVMDLIVALKR